MKFLQGLLLVISILDAGAVQALERLRTRATVAVNAKNHLVIDGEAETQALDEKAIDDKISRLNEEIRKLQLLRAESQKPANGSLVQLHTAEPKCEQVCAMKNGAMECTQDMNICRIQAFYNDTVHTSGTWAKWLAGQQQLYSGLLKNYSALLVAKDETVDGIKWATAAHACGTDYKGVEDSGQSCTQMCGKMGKQCSEDAMKGLNQKENVEAFFKEAGKECTSFEEFKEVYHSWDGPWTDATNVQSGRCAYASSSEWVPDCDRNTLPGLSRLCPCKAPEKPVPSMADCNLKEARHWWSKQFDQQCDPTATIPRPGPIERRFHFVTFYDVDFYKKSMPMELVTPDDPEYWRLSQYQRFLVDNVRYTALLNNATSIRLHDKQSCEAAMLKIDPELLLAFQGEGDLRFKSDLCRSAVLYLEGGVYNDDDQINFAPFFPYLKKSTHFASVQPDHEASAFANSFTAATPCHPILREQLDMMRDVKKPGNPMAEVLKPEGLLGPHTMAYIYARQMGIPFNTKVPWSEKDGTQLLRETHLGLLDSWQKDEKIRSMRYDKECDFGFYDPADNNAVYACSRP